jgi:hypothetical protein
MPKQPMRILIIPDGITLLTKPLYAVFLLVFFSPGVVLYIFFI